MDKLLALRMILLSSTETEIGIFSNKRVQADLRNISDWFDSHLLTINYKKTVFVPFACNKTGLPEFQTLTFINGAGVTHQIQRSQHTKYLGIIIDECLRWDIHINNITRILRSLLYKFKLLTKIIEIPQIRIVYSALVESRIRYGVLGWGGMAKTHLKKLEIMQKWFLKIIYKKDYTYPTELIYMETRVLDVRQIYFLAVVSNQYKNRQTSSSVDHVYPTRHKLNVNLRTTFSGKTIGQRSHTYLGPRLFNCLPVEIKLGINSLSLFKKKVREYLLDTPRTAIHELIDPIT